MTLKKIDANIKSIVTNAGKLNVLIHTTAMMVVAHAKEHGDCTRALALVKAMPASMRRTMLVLWFDTYTPIRVVDKNDKVGILKATDKRFVDWDLEGAEATPFYELAEANPEKAPMTLAALLKLVASLEKRITKSIEEGRVDPVDEASLKAAAIKLSGLTFDRIVSADRADPNNIELEAPKLQAVG